MSPVTRPRRRAYPRLTFLAAAAAMLVLAACADDGPSVLEPRTRATERVEGLWWVMFWISTVVVLFVTAMLLAAVRKGRAQLDTEVDRSPVAWGDRFIVIAGLVVSGVILGGMFLVSLGVLDVLAEPPDDESPLNIEVEGRNWWWEVRYPNGAVTANEIHVPVGRTVNIDLPTADVIHSFWVPQLQVKKDHIPGVRNRLWLVAKEPGRFRGQCAEYCGLQHAHMLFEVVAQPEAEFDSWLARQRRPAAEPRGATATRGRDVFMESSCAGCHRVRGTSAQGRLGPDLTHLADRQTIGAGLMPLERENLRAFVLDAQEEKPGATMPPTEVSPEELAALVDYLLQLK